MKIERIDRDALRVLITTAERALNKELESFGVTIKPGRSKYSNGSTGTLVFELVASGANPNKENFERYAEFVGLKPEDYGREFRSNGETFALRAIDLGRPKFPISADRVRDGKGFKFTKEGIKIALARSYP